MTVKFIHLRLREPFTGMITPKGGVTVAYEEDDQGVVSYAAAICSDKDHYVKAEGRSRSTKRLRTNNRNPDYYKGHIVRSFKKVEGVNIVEQILKHHDANPLT